MAKMTQEEKAARVIERRKAKAAAKTQARIEAEKNQKPVKSITITIEWVKSRTWGSNPHAEADISYMDGTHAHKTGYTCSGCGYDKESTVIADIFNGHMKYKLWALTPDQLERGIAPYGINRNENSYRGYSGGIGTNCYYNISEYIGGKFDKIASGKTFDVYQYINN
jgi:hypothetical protein